MSGGLQGALVFSSVLVWKNVPKGKCIVHVFFFSPSMVMVRKTSTGKIRQCGNSKLTSTRNQIHEGLKEKYLSLCFSLASPEGFALLQKNAVV